MFSTDVASMSVTVTRAVGCCSSSLRDSPPWPAPSSRIFGSAHVGELVEHQVGEPLVVLEHVAGPLQGTYHAALDPLVDVVAVEVFATAGLKAAVQPRRVGPASRHSVDVGDGDLNGSHS